MPYLSPIEPLLLVPLEPAVPPILTITTGSAAAVRAVASPPAHTGSYQEGGGMLEGTAYGDTLRATEGGTILLGQGGDDVLQAAVGGAVFDLFFIGGSGDDTMTGSYGRDSYGYEAGDGHDLIVDDVRPMGPDVTAFFAAHPGTDSYQDRLLFGASIAVSDVQAERVSDDLVLHVKGNEGSVTVEGWYDGTMFNKIESVVFANGTTWLASDIDRMLGQASVGMVASATGPVSGSQYDDVLTATGSALLRGDLGNDTLAAAVDGAVFGIGFEGGRGNDSIQGSYAGDIYYFSRGDGQDTVHDDVRVLGPEVAAYFAANLDAPSYQDRIQFGPGIGVEDLRFASVGTDLVVRIVGTDDAIRFQGWNDGTLFNRIEVFAFYDGTTRTHAQIDFLAGQATPGTTLSGGGVLVGTDASDTLTATAYGTRMIGGAGTDVLQAATGGGIFGLVFEGGTGLDILRGSYAGDTYLYHLGDGNDVIVDDVRSMGSGVADFFLAHPDAASYQDELRFGAGIAAADVTAQRALDNSLVLHVNGTQGSVTIEDWFDGTPFQKIERIAFQDGTTWRSSDIDALFSNAGQGLELNGGGTLVGSQYADLINAQAYGTRVEGNGGNDAIAARIDGSVFDVTFIGGAGDDSIQGSYARDFYHFDAGDGHDVIHDDVRFLSYQVALYFQANPTADTYQDHLLFGAGVDADSVTRSRVDDDLVLGVGADDSVTITGWFDGSNMNKIEVIGFADGTTWSAAMAEYGL